MFCNLLTVCVYIPSTNPNSNPVEVAEISSNLKFTEIVCYGSGDFSSSWGALFLLLTAPPRRHEDGSGLAFRDPAGVAPADLVLRFFPGSRLTSLC